MARLTTAHAAELDEIRPLWHRGFDLVTLRERVGDLHRRHHRSHIRPEHMFPTLHTRSVT